MNLKNEQGRRSLGNPNSIMLKKLIPSAVPPNRKINLRSVPLKLDHNPEIKIITKLIKISRSQHKSFNRPNFMRGFTFILTLIFRLLHPEITLQMGYPHFLITIIIFQSKMIKIRILMQNFQ